MTAGSSAMQQMNSYLDQEKITVNGKEYTLVVNVNMKGMVGKNGEVSPGEIQGDNYTINMDFSSSHFTSSSLFSDVVGADGGGPWHVLPHETYHAVEAAGIGSNPMRGVDPLGLGTTRSGDGKQVLIPGTKLPAHEARATRAGNIVADQIGRTTFSTGYGSKQLNAPALPVPGYAPQK